MASSQEQISLSEGNEYPDPDIDSGGESDTEDPPPNPFSSTRALPQPFEDKEEYDSNASAAFNYSGHSSGAGAGPVARALAHILEYRQKGTPETSSSVYMDDSDDRDENASEGSNNSDGDDTISDVFIQNILRDENTELPDIVKYAVGKFPIVKVDLTHSLISRGSFPVRLEYGRFNLHILLRRGSLFIAAINPNSFSIAVSQLSGYSFPNNDIVECRWCTFASVLDSRQVFKPEVDNPFTKESMRYINLYNDGFSVDLVRDSTYDREYREGVDISSMDINPPKAFSEKASAPLAGYASNPGAPRKKKILGKQPRGNKNVKAKSVV